MFDWDLTEDPACLGIKPTVVVVVQPLQDITFKAFAEATRKRSAEGYNEPLDATSAYGPEHWALMIQEEAGEVAGAVIGMLGMKKRKNHLTAVDVGKEIADVVAYCACLSERYGCDFTQIMPFQDPTLAQFADSFRKVAARYDVVRWALVIQQTTGQIAEAIDSGSNLRAYIREVMVACACLAIRCGLDFQEIVRSKFNEVSDRIGSTVKL